MKRLLLALLAALVLWTVMFSPPTAPHVNFWVMMTASAAVLLLAASSARPRWWREVKWRCSDVLAGIALAALLWGVFWAGDKVAAQLFHFARPQVDLIYTIKEGEPPWLLALLLLFIVGPAEEIFWRGYVQRTLCRHYNANIGFAVATALYALVHVGSCNFMLVMAALTAGVVWGIGYRFFPGRLSALIVSHALWDVAVFILFPI